MGLPVPGDPLPRLELIDARGLPTEPPAGEALYAFFKTTCPTSELAWPYLDRIRRAAEGGALSVIGVSQDDPEETRQFAARTQTSIATVYDPPPWRASEAVGLENVPTLLLVGADGHVREAIVGFQKARMRELARRAAELSGRAPEELFPTDEDVPELKPG